MVAKPPISMSPIVLERKSAMKSCTGVMHKRKNPGGEVGLVESSNVWPTCVVNALFGPFQQDFCCCMYFSAYKFYPTCHVEDCKRHNRPDTDRL